MHNKKKTMPPTLDSLKSGSYFLERHTALQFEHRDSLGGWLGGWMPYTHWKLLYHWLVSTRIQDWYGGIDLSKPHWFETTHIRAPSTVQKLTLITHNLSLHW